MQGPFLILTSGSICRDMTRELQQHVAWDHLTENPNQSKGLPSLSVDLNRGATGNQWGEGGGGERD